MDRAHCGFCQPLPRTRTRRPEVGWAEGKGLPCHQWCTHILAHRCCVPWHGWELNQPGNYHHWRVWSRFRSFVFLYIFFLFLLIWCSIICLGYSGKTSVARLVVKYISAASSLKRGDDNAGAGLEEKVVAAGVAMEGLNYLTSSFSSLSSLTECVCVCVCVCGCQLLETHRPRATRIQVGLESICEFIFLPQDECKGPAPRFTSWKSLAWFTKTLVRETTMSSIR